jgi:hypothetical protein
MRTKLSEHPVPEQFETLEQARDCINQTADALFGKLYTADEEIPSSRQLMEEYEPQASQLKDWNVAFERLMSAKSNLFDSKQIRGAALLKIQHLTVTIMTTVHISDYNDLRTIRERLDDPTTFAPFQPDFATIVSLSRSLVAASEMDAQAGRPSLTFSTDLGLIGPLYYVCTHCHDKDTIEVAAKLLARCPRREGMWDGEATAQMVRAFWEVKKTHSLRQMCPPDEVVGLEMSDGMVWEWKWKWKEPAKDWSSNVELGGGPAASFTASDLPSPGLTPESSSSSSSSSSSWAVSPQFGNRAGPPVDLDLDLEACKVNLLSSDSLGSYPPFVLHASSLAGLSINSDLRDVAPPPSNYLGDIPFGQL